MKHIASSLGKKTLFAAIVFLAMAIPPAAAGKSAFDQGLLWRVSPPGVPASYIVGTVHSADPVLATPSPALRDILDRADRVMIEVVANPENRQKLAMAMLLTDGRRLGDIIGPERFQRVVEAGARYGIPAENLSKLKPLGALGIFSIPPSELKRQASGPSLDQVVANAASNRDIPVLGIETAEEQVAALAGGSESDLLVMLDAALDQSAQIEDSFKELRRIYLAGDLAGLYNLAMKDAGPDTAAVVERYYKRLLWDRNRRMAERIVPHIEKGNTLIAVGALHLYGDDGVPGLLAQAGYEVSVVE